MKKYIYILLIIFISCICFTGCNHNSGSDTDNNDAANDSLTIDNISEDIRKDPANADLFFRRSQLFFENQQIDEAINDLTIAIKLDSLAPDQYIRIAEYHLLKGNSGKAKDMLERCISLIPENTNALVGLAKIHLYVKQYDESMNVLLKAQKINEHLPDIYFIKGLIYKETFDTIRAIDNFQITVDKEPGCYEAYMILGDLYSKLKDKLAIDYFNNAKQLVPESIEAYYNSGMYYQDNGKYDQAIAEYKSIIQDIDSTFAYAHYNIGYVHMEYFKEYDKAIACLTRAITSDDQYAEAYHNRGYCYEQQKKFKQAREDYRKALDIIPNYQLSIDGLNRIDNFLKH